MKEEKIEKEENTKKEKELKKETNTKKEKKKINKGLIIILLIVIIIGIFVYRVFFYKKNDIEIKIKTSLDKIAERSDLQVMNITYNIIAKECKNEKKCNKESNDIDEFKYVVSCKGVVTTGIDFKEVKIDVDETNKKVIITIPKATIKETNITDSKFLNKESDKSAFVAGRKLCEEETKKRVLSDENILNAANDQAKIVLDAFYRQWIKAYDSSYKIEFKQGGDL